MVDDERTRAWRALTPAQQAMLRRLDREGTLLSVAPWEMRTVRSLLVRGLVRPRRSGRADVGLWFLSAKGSRLLPGAETKARAARGPREDPRPDPRPDRQLPEGAAP